ncbi:T9SS type A sorting domain-containing protein [Dyadobacter sp. CY356]|uniref:T9SS type A sorting domain-containing protein n=1 Tax=Dyadobacter sp. CY356 TaxID=2906442 RepID=UPI001F1B2157|nr:T9SS type A sorting domain-containing protein [Dyadobacter sp. CY356]MCF0054149.1 T9SS type A sorting domain-containing protein [Dyadobacter sp. CY356]
MKITFTSAIIAFVLSATTIFSANAEDKEVKKVTGFDSGIYASRDGKIKINIDKYNNAATAILFQDSNGNIVYKETAGRAAKKLRREIDVNQLKSGNYLIEISSKGEKQTKVLQLTEKTTERAITVN